MPWIKGVIQIGLRGIGSAREGEVEAARDYGAELISAYELPDIGMDAVLDRIPAGGSFYLTIDVDGIDPTIMPTVMAQTLGGLNWVQTRKLVRCLVNKGRAVGMDLVEIAPKKDVASITAIHAERLIENVSVHRYVLDTAVDNTTHYHSSLDHHGGTKPIGRGNILPAFPAGGVLQATSRFVTTQQRRGRVTAQRIHGNRQDFWPIPRSGNLESDLTRSYPIC